MFQAQRLREVPQRENDIFSSTVSCLHAIARCLCCIDPTDIPK